jgi:hypothetical protein
MQGDYYLSSEEPQVLRHAAQCGPTLVMNTSSPSSTPKQRPRRPTRQIPLIPTQSDNDQQQDPDPLEHHLVLTPLRAHYLKKSLIQLQFHKELDDLTNAPSDGVSTLAYLGHPFSPPPKTSRPLDLPFLKYIFRRFVLTFPLLAAADESFYSEKLQVFVASALARNISPSSFLEDEGDPKGARLKLLDKVERNLALFFSSGTKLVEAEEVVRLNQNDLDRLERLAKKRLARLAKHRDVFEVNIVCVRTVTDKGRVRSRLHEVLHNSIFNPQYSHCLYRNSSSRLDFQRTGRFVCPEGTATSKRLLTRYVFVHVILGNIP